MNRGKIHFLTLIEKLDGQIKVPAVPPSGKLFSSQARQRYAKNRAGKRFSVNSIINQSKHT